jgi:putative glycosyltransferase
MPKLLQINVTANSGATGKISEEIGAMAIHRGWDSAIAFSRGTPISQSQLIHIGTPTDIRRHGLATRLLDRHGLQSKKATADLCRAISELKPDIIHLHNIHGYYINYKLLFDFLRRYDRPVVWTLHDCWAFTGHCSHFESIGCDKWKLQCYNCGQLHSYPASFVGDRSRANYLDRKAAFTSLGNLTLVSPSRWLDGLISESFLSEYPKKVIHNGIDINLFRPYEKSNSKSPLILASAWVWNKSKGLGDVLKLREMIPDNYRICLVGLTAAQVKRMPPGITGITRTENQKALARLYSQASVFVNPTYGDTFPTTNLEALACGTPVATYRTGGSPEAIDPLTGRVVERGDVRALCDAIGELMAIPPKKISRDCRERAVRLFDQRDRFAEYIDLYNSLLGN